MRPLHTTREHPIQAVLMTQVVLTTQAAARSIPVVLLTREAPMIPEEVRLILEATRLKGSLTITLLTLFADSWHPLADSAVALGHLLE